jgi:protein involved in polysaccharide export with SLBB domain
MLITSSLCLASCTSSFRNELSYTGTPAPATIDSKPSDVSMAVANESNVSSRTAQGETVTSAVFADDASAGESSVLTTPFGRIDRQGAHPAFWAANADENTVELESLLESRSQEETDSDFVIGVGDVLEISVPAIDQLKAVDVRVLGDGTITLPLVGRVSAAGKTEEQLGDELRDRLREYMYHPQLGVFVKEYQSREVSVIGALDKPGLYTLANSHETLLSMIGKAGGLTDKAGARILFVPADMMGPNAHRSPHYEATADPALLEHPAETGPIVPEKPQRESPIGPTDAVASVQLPTSVETDNTKYLFIELDRPGLWKYLQIPARPGDTIVVNQAGEVTVQGWVQTPGAFKITPGLTLLGAVAAAGGELFSSNARILRTEDDGDQTTIWANLSKIRNHQQPNIPVQAGDVVIVDRSLLGSGPYLIYTLFTKFNTGMYLPPP